MEEKKLSKIQEGILYFILYSFLGWCLETFYAFMVYGYFVKRGFLYGPICPIYGFGAILLLYNLKNVKGGNFIKFWISLFVFSVFEYIASFALEAVFNQRWWDYSNNFMNLQGRICLAFLSIYFYLLFLFALLVLLNLLSNHILRESSSICVGSFVFPVCDVIAAAITVGLYLFPIIICIRNCIYFCKTTREPSRSKNTISI